MKTYWQYLGKWVSNFLLKVDHLFLDLWFAEVLGRHDVLVYLVGLVNKVSILSKAMVVIFLAFSICSCS